ncbi:helix-turn-helix domain-containing protein [Spirillospora sp. NPDC047279]|uniref:helix-turn-helix domain-containing protein n=1 Tax=Spirillospora sp. NPDC047279 TaxID=3155478 RepID=UPI0033DF60CA
MNAARYSERPAPPGSGLACLWSHELAADAGGPFEQRVVPDGCVDLIWWSRDARIQVAGPDTGPVPARLEPGDRLIGVRFGPGAAPPALGVPADAVRDGRLPLRELWGDEADRLGEALAGAADPQRVLARAALDRGAAAGPPDPIVAPLLDGLSGLPVGAAADALGIGERQLRRRVLAAFGYGPKTVQRVLRFQRALSLAYGGVPLADVAYAAGYSDQAHLAHDVRELAGAPLTTLLRPGQA